MKRIIAISCIAVVLVAAGVAVARANARGWTQGWNGCFHHGMGHWGPMGYVAHELDLTDAQEQQISSMWQTEKPALSGLIQEFAAESREMDSATANGNLDESKVQQIATRQGATLSKLLVEKEHFTAKVYASVLTPEQRSKADKMQSRWHEHLEHIGKGLE